MAEEETTEEESSAPPPPAPGRAKHFFILIFIVLIGQVGIGYWAIFHVFVPKMEGEEVGEVSEEAWEEEEQSGGGEEGHGGGGGGGEKEAGSENVHGDLLDVGQVTTSTTQGGELHYIILMAKIKFNTHETALVAGKNLARIKDLILYQVSLKPGEELDDVDDQERLREDIREAVNAILTKGRAEEIYFTQYVFH